MDFFHLLYFMSTLNCAGIYVIHKIHMFMDYCKMLHILLKIKILIGLLIKEITPRINTLFKIKVLHDAMEEPFCLNGSIKNL